MIHNLAYVFCHEKWPDYLGTELNKERAMNFQSLVWSGTFGSSTLNEILTKKHNFTINFLINNRILIKLLIVFLYFDERCC